MEKGGLSHLPPFLPQGTVQGKLFVVNGSRMIARKRANPREERNLPFPVQKWNLTAANQVHPLKHLAPSGAPLVVVYSPPAINFSMSGSSGKK